MKIGQLNTAFEKLNIQLHNSNLCSAAIVLFFFFLAGNGPTCRTRNLTRAMYEVVMDHMNFDT